MGWLIALAILVLLGCLPLGISVIYDESGAVANWLIGPVKISLYPGKKKDKKEDTKAKKDSDSSAEKKQEQKAGGNLSDFMPLVKTAVEFLDELRCKIRVRRLEMLLCMAGGDPCDLGINYGRAWAAVGNIMPQLERFLVIKKRDIQVTCDFIKPQTTIYFRADITIPLWQLLGLLLRYGWRAYKEYETIRNKGKGGAQK